MAQNGIFQVIPLLQALNTIRGNQGASTVQMPQFQMPNVQAPDYSQSMGQERQAQDLLSQLVNMQSPAPVRPAFRTEDAIKGALGLLLGGGQNPGEFVAGYLQGKQGKAEGDTQRKMQDFNLQRQGMASQAEGLQRQAGLSRQMEGDRYDREYKTAYDTALRKFQGEQDRFNASQRILGDLAGVKTTAGLLGLQEAARQLNIPLDQRAIAAAQASIKETEDFAKAQKESMSEDRRLNIERQAISNWDTRLNQFRDDYGLIKPTAYKQLMAEREAIAKRYGMEDMNVLQMPYADATVQQQRLAQYSKDLANKWANAKVKLDYERQRLDLAEQRFAQSQTQFAALERDRATKNYLAAVREYNLNVRSIAGADGQRGGKAKGRADTLSNQIIEKRAKQSIAKDQAVRQKLEAEIQDLAAARKALLDSIVEEPKTPSVIGGAVNPLQGAIGGGGTGAGATEVTPFRIPPPPGGQEGVKFNPKNWGIE